MSDEITQAVGAPLERQVRRHTAGPWNWYMNERGEAQLATPDRGRLYVMQPVRCGMQGGTVRFSEWGEGERGRRGGVMRDAKDHLQAGVLMHPDALLIAAAPELAAFAQWVLKAYHSEDGMPEPKELAREARAALAQAGIRDA